MSGDMVEGEMLPSMRLLAKELRISVITTKRAYEELENDGFIVSVVGKGSFVAAKNIDFMREEQLKKVERHLIQTVESAQACGLDLTELVEMLSMIYKGE
jgi:GntR family transcriptional regulator